jgi:glutamine synthetase
MNNNTEEQQCLLDEIKQFRDLYPDVQDVDLIAMDIPGNFFGKRYAIAQLEKLAIDGLKLPAAMYLMSVQGSPVSAKGYGEDDGDPDAQMKLVPGSLHLVSWESQPCAQMMLTGNDDNEHLTWEPRKILAAVLDTLREEDIHPIVAFEPEFYLLDQQRSADGAIQPPRNPASGERDRCAVLNMERISGFGDCLRDITRSCREQNIETGPISAELGVGQYEINLNHHNDPLLAADQCAYFKRIVKGVAIKNDFQATFMAKPYREQPGNGMHLHISFYDGQGNNLLLEKKQLQHSIAGCLQIMPESMPIFAANRNAYRRLEVNNATTVSASWGYENRSVAVRVPISDEANTRIEHRVASADTNPYLALAAILAGMHYGLKNNLNPGSPLDFNSTEAAGLPTDFMTSLQVMKESKKLGQYFGQEFVELYVEQKHSELKSFEDYIAPREYDWYL